MQKSVCVSYFGWLAQNKNLEIAKSQSEEVLFINSKFLVAESNFCILSLI
jgi:hypothetical protein